MSWANCGEDSNGRPIGYAVEAICDHEGCYTQIDRGLGYCCGGMHGGGDEGCGGYFCGEHTTGLSLCRGCFEALPDNEDEVA